MTGDFKNGVVSSFEVVNQGNISPLIRQHQSMHPDILTMDSRPAVEQLYLQITIDLLSSK